VGHMSRSSALLHVESSLARVFQSILKTSGDAMVSGARGTIAEVASESVEDGCVDVMGCIEPCYLYFVVFILLGHRCIVVI
jgi:hypothetical protein